jgi:hypothetical protein
VHPHFTGIRKYLSYIDITPKDRNWKEIKNKKRCRQSVRRVPELLLGLSLELVMELVVALIYGSHTLALFSCEGSWVKYPSFTPSRYDLGTSSGHS